MDSRIATYEHIQTVQRILMGLIGDLQKRLLVHDQSKLVTPEVEVFDEYTPKLANSTYGSDEYKSFLAGMKVGLDHHYYSNSHHPEHFQPEMCQCVTARSELPADELENAHRVYGNPAMLTDFVEHNRQMEALDLVANHNCTLCFSTGWVKRGILGMSLLDIVEMLADWKAATLRHKDGDLLKSLEINQKRFGYSDELKQIMLNTVSLLKD